MGNFDRIRKSAIFGETESGDETIPETFTRWDAVNDLKTEEDARLYLASCAEEDPGDGSLVRLAVADVARAGLAQETGAADNTLRESPSDESARFRGNDVV